IETPSLLAFDSESTFTAETASFLRGDQTPDRRSRGGGHGPGGPGRLGGAWKFDPPAPRGGFANGTCTRVALK
ncbi:MAG: hypothetical protein ACYDC1_08795, partial [Limisphaerales bacterium]